MPKSRFVFCADYADRLSSPKQRSAGARQRYALDVNNEPLLLYRQVHQQNQSRQKRRGWGSKAVDLLAENLTAAFPAEATLQRGRHVADAPGAAE
jgi:hypothetical protein